MPGDEQESGYLHSSPGRSPRGVFQDGIAFKSTCSLVVFHAGLRIITLITFLFYPGSCLIKPKQKVPLNPSRLLFLL